MIPLFLSACAIEGDFGRPRPTILDQVADQWLASETTLLGSRGGSGVTDDEIAMREAGHLLARPLGLGPAAPVQGSHGGYKDGYVPARMADPLTAVMQELDADHHNLTIFGRAARRVLATDSRRMEAVREHDPYILVEDKRSARERMQENFSFIETVFEDFGQRLQGYHYAIEDIGTGMPGAPTAEAQGSLQHLGERKVSLEYELTHYFRGAVARGDYRPTRFATRARPGAGAGRPYAQEHYGSGYSAPGNWNGQPFK